MFYCINKNILNKTINVKNIDKIWCKIACKIACNLGFFKKITRDFAPYFTRDFTPYFTPYFINKNNNKYLIL